MANFQKTILILVGLNLFVLLGWGVYKYREASAQQDESLKIRDFNAKSMESLEVLPKEKTEKLWVIRKRVLDEKAINDTDLSFCLDVYSHGPTKSSPRNDESFVHEVVAPLMYVSNWKAGQLEKVDTLVNSLLQKGQADSTGAIESSAMALMVRAKLPNKVSYLEKLRNSPHDRTRETANAALKTIKK